jgi:hypothetical protein
MSEGRKLSSIQRIESLDPIPGADRIEVARVLGWNLVVAKGEFTVGDRCVFFEIDSLLPKAKEFDFMAERSYRVKTIKLRKQISQGLAMPLDKIHFVNLSRCKVGEDVSGKLGVTKYEPPSHGGSRVPRAPKTWLDRLWYRVRSWFGIVPPPELGWPSFIQKTDETRIQSAPAYLERHDGELHYITEKCDGSSCTMYLYKGKFGVCSRNCALSPKRVYKDQRRHMLTMATKFKVEESLRKLGRNLAIQGEAIGPEMNGNKYRLKEHQLRLFSVIDLDTKKRLPFDDATRLASFMGLEWCPIIGVLPLHATVDGLVSASAGLSKITTGEKGYKPIQREGLVYRAMVDGHDRDMGHLSFKIISPKFLLDHADDEDVGVVE